MAAAALAGCGPALRGPLTPRVDGPWWTVARNPDLGELNGPPKDQPKAHQQPVDFAVWQAADGTWQLWSCVRGTNCGGKTRLLYGWEGQKLTDANWKPMGIRMQADPAYGETPGGLQAPYVIRHNGTYHMFYGDWVNICIARGTDGKSFERWPMANGRTGMFNEGENANARDPMVCVGPPPVSDGCAPTTRLNWYCYYTAHADGKGADFCRTSTDLRTWSESRVVARGGLTGEGPWSAECPHVVRTGGYYYLFRTQRYADPPATSVYRSDDPMDFGVGNDDKFVCLLPVAAPEVILDRGQWYIAALTPDIQGIRIARLRWE
jgi:hypothetical protein